MVSRIFTAFFASVILTGCFGSGQSVQVVGPSPASSNSNAGGSPNSNSNKKNPTPTPAPTPAPTATPTPTPAAGSLSAVPTSIAFDTVIIGQGASNQTISIANSAGENADFVSNPNTFNFSSGCGSVVSVSPGAPAPECVDKVGSKASCNLTISFQPTAAVALSGCKLSISYRYASSSATTRQLDISISGSGSNSAPQTKDANDASKQWDLAKINAPNAWATRTDCSSVPVAVIDTGVDPTLQDLRANIDLTHIFGATGGNYTLGEAAVKDDNGHGTHVSGTIGAIGNNATDVSGICWKAKIMAYKTMNAAGAGTVNDTLNAIGKAANDGAKVINLSLGGWQVVSYVSNGSTVSTGVKETYDTAIKNAQAKGVFLVFAAGNDGANIDAPQSKSCSDGNGGTVACDVMSLPAGLGSSYTNTISVASTDSNDNMSSFSNYGATVVEIAAPGSRILSLRSSAINAGQSGIAGVCPSGTTCTLDGTSMAAPHVAGAMTLLWAQNTSLTIGNIKQFLIDRAKTVGAITCTTTPIKSCDKGGKRLSLETLLNP